LVRIHPGVIVSFHSAGGVGGGGMGNLADFVPARQTLARETAQFGMINTMDSINRIRLILLILQGGAAELEATGDVSSTGDDAARPTHSVSIGKPSSVLWSIL
jgi:hypothetical protein